MCVVVCFLALFELFSPLTCVVCFFLDCFSFRPRIISCWWTLIGAVVWLDDTVDSCVAFPLASSFGCVSSGGGAAVGGKC